MTPGNGNGRPVAPHESRKQFALDQLNRANRRIEQVKVENEAKLIAPRSGNGHRRYQPTGRQILTVVFSARTDK